jgi:hypothetical protein
MDCFVAPLLLMNTWFVIMSPAAPGVVIQLDGHGAKRLAMTFLGFNAAIYASPRVLAARSRNDRVENTA